MRDSTKVCGDFVELSSALEKALLLRVLSRTRVVQDCRFPPPIPLAEGCMEGRKRERKKLITHFFFTLPPSSRRFTLLTQKFGKTADAESPFSILFQGVGNGSEGAKK